MAEIKCDRDFRDVYCIYSRNRALLPDLVKFSYVPFQEFQAENHHKDASNRTDDYAGFTSPTTLASQQGSVLVLDFVDNLKNKKSSTISTTSA